MIISVNILKSLCLVAYLQKSKQEKRLIEEDLVFSEKSTFPVL